MQIYQILTDGLFRQNGTILQGRRNQGAEEHGGWTKAPLPFPILADHVKPYFN